MKNFLGTAGIGLALALGACGGETAATGGQAVATGDADTSRNWTEVVSKTDEGGFAMGKPDAPIKVVEYASLTCSHCADFSTTGFEPLKEQYISQGLVNYELRNFVRDPLDLTAAMLTRCNGATPYFTLTERMFANQPQFFERLQNADQAQLQAVATPEAMQSGQAFIAYAEAAGFIDFVGTLGIPEARARQCLTDHAAVEEIEQMRNRAITQINLQGTPTFTINGEVAEGVVTWEQLNARLQEMTQ